MAACTAAYDDLVPFGESNHEVKVLLGEMRECLQEADEARREQQRQQEERAAALRYRMQEGSSSADAGAGMAAATDSAEPLLTDGLLTRVDGWLEENMQTLKHGNPETSRYASVLFGWAFLRGGVAPSSLALAVGRQAVQLARELQRVCALAEATKKGSAARCVCMRVRAWVTVDVHAV